MLNLLKNSLFLFNKKKKIIIIFIFFNSILISFLELVGIGIIPLFLSYLIDPEKLMNSHFYYLNYLKSLDLKKENIIFFGSILIIIFFIIKNVYSIFSIFLQEIFFKNTRIDLVKKLLNFYLRKDYNFFLNTNSTILIRNILNESIISMTFITTLLNFFKEMILSFVILFSLIILKPFIVLTLAFLVSLSISIYFYFTRKKIKSISLKAREFRGYQLKDLNHLFSSIKLVKIFNKEDFFSNTFLKKFSESENLRLIVLFFTRIPRHIVEILVVCLLLFFLYVMTNTEGKSFLEIIPILTFFTICALRLMPAINVLTASLPTLRSSYTSLQFIVKDLKESEQITDKKLNLNINQSLKLDKGKKILFEDVSFKYVDSTVIFEKANLSIKIGETVAFMGNSGTGKSTLIDLLMGLQKPKEGSIKFDKEDIHNNIRNWQKNFGFIPQNVNLIDDSIRNNIAFGVDPKNIDNNQIEKCLKLAQLEQLVHESIYGLETIIGEKGSRISGGQIQRIGIARALYNNPKILIFDESTNSLDKMTEKLLLNEIFGLKDKFTIIIITHDLSIAERCNIIYEITNKKIKLLKN